MVKTWLYLNVIKNKVSNNDRAFKYVQEIPTPHPAHPNNFQFFPATKIDWNKLANEEVCCTCRQWTFLGVS